MKTEFFIAHRLVFDKNKQKTFSRPIINIVITGIALSVAVIIISVAVVTGFKKEITKKIVGFGSHIQISNYDSNNSFENMPIQKNDTLYKWIKALDGVRHIQMTGTKPGIIKSKGENQGAIIKGVGPDFDWDFFSGFITEGKQISICDSVTTNEVIISKNIGSLLNLNIGDKFVMYFIQDTKRTRVFTVSAIYETCLDEFDKLFILTDIKHIQKLNNWDTNLYGRYEVFINDFRDLDKITYSIRRKISSVITSNNSFLKALNIREKYPQIFDWLGLQDINVLVILIIVIIVAGINMITGLLVIIIERTNMIGVLKSLGASNSFIKKMFLFHAAYLIGYGLIIGNIIGLSVCFLQNKYEFISLDKESYYLNTVPINLNLSDIIFINIGTLAIIITILILPAAIISKIDPVKAIRFN